ncbi:hypothetical protein [Butyrivibrio sp. XPD2002]|uniref:hypothetical protein n=1 Tax=Butyrivibrio sp. XPD2002 TaxID=1280665 RepID=UPI00047E7D35|nr:hypothetical protein [Butyrivibrio sp. XPD2002]
MVKKKIALKDLDTGYMTRPSISKYSFYCQAYFSTNKNISTLSKINPLVIDSNNIIIDGYCTYLIALENKIQKINCIIQEPDESLVKIVSAQHLKKNLKFGTKVYNWKTHHIPVCPGLICSANTNSGKALVRIINIEMRPSMNTLSLKNLSSLNISKKKKTPLKHYHENRSQKGNHCEL